jgi:hypothetical protein
MPIDSHLPQADPFSLVPTFKHLFFKFTSHKALLFFFKSSLSVQYDIHDVEQKKTKFVSFKWAQDKITKNLNFHVVEYVAKIYSLTGRVDRKSEASNISELANKLTTAISFLYFFQSNPAFLVMNAYFFIEIYYVIRFFTSGWTRRIEPAASSLLKQSPPFSPTSSQSTSFMLNFFSHRCDFTII